MDETSGDGVEDFTLEMSLALDSDGSRIAEARHLAVAFLSQARDDHAVPVGSTDLENAQLIVSELVTNARKYAPGPALLHLRISGGTVQIELWDSNPVAPAAAAPDPERVGRHGLEIVAAVARTVMVERTPVGKRIVAHVVLSAVTR